MGELIAVTVLGHDRPGIIADVTARLADLGVNLEDSSMTLLRGHFAMTLVCSGAPDVAAVEGALAPVTEGGDLTVSVRTILDQHVDATGADTVPYVLSVHGGDRPGIVSAVIRAVADVGGNVSDLTTRLAGDLYVVIAEVALPVQADVETLQARLLEAGRELGVDVSLRAQEIDLL